MADELLKKEFMLLGSFPVVPKDKARIRVQLSAAHTKEHLDKAIVHLLKLPT
jgi:glycine C-acetyltransferase